MKVAVQWLALALCCAATSAVAADSPGLPAQVPGACASPDLSRLSSDDERHTSIRAYLMCLGEQNQSSQALSGALGRPAPGGADSRTPGRARELRMDTLGRPLDADGAVAQ